MPSVPKECVQQRDTRHIIVDPRTAQQQWDTIARMTERRTCTTAFKAKVVLELLREEEPLARVRV